MLNQLTVGGPSPATVTETEPLQTSVGTAHVCSAPRRHGGRYGIFYSTTQHIYSIGGGVEERGPPPLPPPSQLCSCVDECEQIFLAVSVSTPQVSALQKHVAAAAPLGGPHMLLQGREENGKKEENLASASKG